MKTEVQKKNPETRWGIPIWCHHHCMKMRAREFDYRNKLFVIANNAARVTITPRSRLEDKGWNVDWEVRHSHEEKAMGRVCFSTQELRSAFGLSDESGEWGGWLIDQYGADSAQQFKYIRWGDYLNIPCPGTGHDGDPNVSIELDDEIRQYISQLIDS